MLAALPGFGGLGRFEEDIRYKRKISGFVPRFKTFRSACLGYIRIRKKKIAYQTVKIVTGSNELPKRADRWTKRIKFLGSEAPFGVGAAEVGEFSQQSFNDHGLHGLGNAGADL